eukprot:tig00000615_g2566.t1
MTAVTPAEVELAAILGEGGFSDVWAGRLHGSTECAIKKPHDGSRSRVALSAVTRAHTRELDVLTQAGYHQNIVRLLACSSDEQQPFLVLEKMDFNLRELIEAYGPLEEAVCAHVCAGVLRGIIHLLDRRIIYSDLKSMNVLLTERLDVKLCDFGLSVMMHAETESFRPQRPTPVDEPVSSPSKPLQGTERWMAPEVRSGAAPTAASDVWSLGAVIFEMCTRELPPKGANSMETDDIKSRALRSIVHRCTDPNAANRPTPWELLAEFERMAAAPQARGVVERLAAALEGQGPALCRGAQAARRRREGAAYGAYQGIGSLRLGDEPAAAAPPPAFASRAPLAGRATFAFEPSSRFKPAAEAAEKWLSEMTSAVGDLLWKAFKLDRLGGAAGAEGARGMAGMPGLLYDTPTSSSTAGAGTDGTGSRTRRSSRPPRHAPRAPGPRPRRGRGGAPALGSPSAAWRAEAQAPPSPSPAASGRSTPHHHQRALSRGGSSGGSGSGAQWHAHAEFQPIFLASPPPPPPPPAPAAGPADGLDRFLSSLSSIGLPFADGPADPRSADEAVEWLAAAPRHPAKGARAALALRSFLAEPHLRSAFSSARLPDLVALMASPAPELAAAGHALARALSAHPDARAALVAAPGLLEALAAALAPRRAAAPPPLPGVPVDAESAAGRR